MQWDQVRDLLALHERLDSLLGGAEPGWTPPVDLYETADEYVVTVEYSESGGYQGIGFAVPSNLARRVMSDLIRYGYVRRGSIGFIDVMPLTTQRADRLGAPDARGALVSRMRRDADAYAAGLRPGDIIRTFNGDAVEDVAHFWRMLSDASIGSTARLGIIRDGRQMEIRVPISQARVRKWQRR